MALKDLLKEISTTEKLSLVKDLNYFLETEYQKKDQGDQKRRLKTLPVHHI